MTNSGTLTFERYNNSGTRSEAAKGAYNTNEWNDVIISIADGITDVYVNGTRTSSVNSTVNISDMLGKIQLHISVRLTGVRASMQQVI